MLLEHSALAWPASCWRPHKQIVILTLVAALFFPLGLAEGFAPIDLLLAGERSSPSCLPWRPFWAWSSPHMPSCDSSVCRSSSAWGWYAPSWRWR